jgi:integrase
MAMTMTLKHLQRTPSGKWQYRRRWPTALSEVVSRAPFKKTLQGRSEAELLREYPKVEAEYHRQVKAMLGEQVSEKVRSARAAWEAAVREGNRLVGEVVGLDDEADRRDVLAESLLARKADPVLIKAIMAPKESPPEHSLWDAQELYLKEKLKGGEGSENREARVRLERVFGRVRAALGDRADVSLIEMTRQNAKDIVAHMLATERNGGGKLSPASVKREIAQLKAVVAYAIKEFDLEGKAINRFSGLEIEGTQGIAAELAAEEKRLPLPRQVVAEMRRKLTGDLNLIWRLLDGTGCRLAEVTGLRVEDVIIDGDLPHLRVRWHADRRVKTRSSIRSIPLVGDTLEAAREAVKLAGERTALFPSYARERGPDAASAILMKHLRSFSRDKRHTVHSLRHGMKDRMRKAGIEKTTQDLILGHAIPGAAEGYGKGGEGVLDLTMKAMRKVAEGS